MKEESDYTGREPNASTFGIILELLGKEREKMRGKLPYLNGY